MLQQIEGFRADHGGTNIVHPLTQAQQWPLKREGMNKRVFILTDGQVSDRDAVVNAARLHSEQVRVFTFGLGSGCDE